MKDKQNDDNEFINNPGDDSEEPSTEGELPRPSLTDAFVGGDEKSDLDKSLELMLSPENIHHNTELTQDEITAFSILGPISIKYDIKILKAFLAENMKLRVSKGRKGRQEFIKILTRGLAQEEQKKAGLLDRFRL